MDGTVLDPLLARKGAYKIRAICGIYEKISALTSFMFCLLGVLAQIPRTQENKIKNANTERRTNKEP